MKSIKFIALLLCIIVGLTATVTIFMLKNEELITENEMLKQEISDYKWQIEQIPYVIEANLDSWCHGGYQ